MNRLHHNLRDGIVDWSSSLTPLCPTVPALPSPAISNCHWLLLLPCWGGQKFLKEVTKPCYLVQSPVTWSSPQSHGPAFCPLPHSWASAFNFLTTKLTLTSFTLSSDLATPLSGWRSPIHTLMFFYTLSFWIFTCSFFPHILFYLRMIY